MARRQQPTEPPKQDAWDHTPEPEIKWPGSGPNEEMVLGAILVGGAEQFDKAAAIISQEDLLLQKHQICWRALVDLRERNDGLDVHSLGMELNSTGKLNLVEGGLSWIVSITAGVPDVPHLAGYCRRIKEASARRRLMVTAQAMLVRAQDEAVPVDELILNATTTFEDVQTVPQDQQGRSPERIVDDFPGGIEAFLDPTQRRRGLPTGFAKFDEMTGGLHGGELIILAARPSMGKTALALNIVQHLCLHPRQRRCAAVFSLEMTGSSLLTRMLCGSARVDQHKFRAGFLNAEERRKLQIGLTDIIDSRMILFDEPGQTVPDIARHVRRLVKDEGLHIVVIDYLQLLGSKGRNENRTQEVSAMSRGLKLLAAETKIPVVVLSQLNRSAETRPGNHKPQLSDLRDSGSIEQDADVVAFIYREEVYKSDREDLKGLADLIIAKQRNGPIGTVSLRWLGHLTRFENRAEDLEDPAN